MSAANRGLAGPALLVAAALLLGSPMLVLGAPATDSGYFNWNWAEGFAWLLARGVMPRWLPDAFGGLGSPTFVFYAPLPFLLTAPLFWIGGGAIDPNRIMAIAQVAMLAASGLAMRAWLLPRSGAMAAVIGAVFYMLAPYHLFDLYVRGSIGEIAAYAVLPLVMLALDRTLRMGASQAPWLAAGVAALLLCHLPTALLAGVFLVAPCLVFAMPRSPARAGIASGAAVAGLVLAAFHWVPAIGLTAANAFDLMATGRFEAARWLLLDPGAWVATGYMTFIAAASLGLAAVAVLTLAMPPPKGAGRTEAVFWGGLTLAGLALMAGAVPAIWSAPSPLARVQFPWRLLVILDFAAITGLCIGISATGGRRWVGVAAWLLACLPAHLMLAAAAWPIQRTVTEPAWHDARRDLAALRPDPGEYLPAGHWLAQSAAGRADIAHVRQIIASVGRSDAAWGEPPDGALVAATPSDDGRLRLTVASPAGGRVVLRRFHFPAWVLVRRADGLVLHGEAHGPDRLLSFVIPPGHHVFDLDWRSPPAMRLAMAASAAGWLLWLGAVLVCRRRRPGAIGATPHPT